MGRNNKIKSNIMNMTEGNPLGLLLRFALPMFLGNLFQQLYNLADTIIVGRLVGANALAAVGVTGSITFLFFALCNGIGSGGGIITSQYFGRGDDTSVKKCISNTGIIMVVFPLIVGTVAYLLADPILRLLSTPEDIFADSLTYLKVMCIGLLFVSLYNYASAMLRSLGDSKTPLIFLVISCVLNVALDLLFVIVFKAGVLGAAVATVISQFLSGIMCLFFAIKTNEYFKMKKEDFELDKNIVGQVLKLGIPMSLQFSLIAISCMALQSVVNSFGQIAVAAFTATSRIEQLIHQPYTTLGSSLSTFVGQNYGANKKDRIVNGYHQSLMIMFLFSMAMLPFMWFFGDDITAWFVSDQDVIIMGATALKITSIFYVFLGMIYVVRGVLNGLSDAFFSLLNGIIEVIGRFTVPFALCAVSFIGVWGIWWSVGVVWFLSGFTAWLRYRFFVKKHEIV
ncbi:MAG: MATE family efflux transporter [Lachnospiraceae bacterium]|nr:MATE family efflux transporter [Lachnospiraceae bacterium]